MDNIFEEIFLDEELELIIKRMAKFQNIPAAHVGERYIYFNRLSSKIIPDFIKWYTSSNLVIGTPSEKNDYNAYYTRRANDTVMASIPTTLIREKKIKKGYYQIYKYKDGFCFKRYEPLED